MDRRLHLHADPRKHRSGAVMTGRCKVDGCDRSAHRRGFCTSHYFRWRRHGDPLAGPTPNGEPETFYRDVVLAYDGDECLIWPYTTNSSGYAVLKRDGRRYTVSRVLCEEVHGAPPTPEHHAAHSCGRGQYGCVAKNHLSWKTPAGNAADTVAHGRTTRGERNRHAKLDEASVLEIRQFLRSGDSQSAVAARFRVHQSTISYIASGRLWGWVQP
jgi:hypothetical protein